MAIQFARIEIVGRSSGGSACRKSAYNARIAMQDERNDIIYNFVRKGDNVYHKVLLPEYVDKKYSDPRILMNEVEYCEKRKNSQLLKDVVIALPDDKELTLEDRIAITHEIIEEMGWVKNGLGVQLDIHQPHDGEKNWHAHLLITTRRFTPDGTILGAKAVNLNPEFRKVKGKAFIIPEEQMIHERAKNIINNYFEKLGLANRVDPIAMVPQRHVRRVRLRSNISKAAEDNKLRQIANIELIKDSTNVLKRITRQQSVFSVRDIARAVKKIPHADERVAMVNKVLNDEQLVKLYYTDGKESKYYTTKEVRAEEVQLFKLADEIRAQKNYSGIRCEQVQQAIAQRDDMSTEQRKAVSYLISAERGIRILRGRAGTGKSHVLGTVGELVAKRGQHVIGLAPTHKAVSGLGSRGYQDRDTVKGFLFKLYNGKVTLKKKSLLVVDEAAMVGTSDYLELFKVAKKYRCNLVLAGDERQLSSIDRGGVFAVLAEKFGACVLSDMKRQSKTWGQEMAKKFADYDVVGGLMLLETHRGLRMDADLKESMNSLISDWQKSRFATDEKLVITVRNRDVDELNKGIREVLKASGRVGQEEYQRITSSRDGVKCEDFAIGDRIIFKSTDKKLKIENGEFACLGAVSQRKFTALTDSGKVVCFDPTEVNFKHGYATTVYKAQGASIKDVYVLHDNVGNNRNTYVAMTRHVDEVKLYTNIESTRNHKHLIAQLSRADERLASINFMTQAELLEKKREDMPVKTTSLREKMSNWFKSIADNISNKWRRKPEHTPSLPPKVKYECPERDIMQKVMVIPNPESLIAKTQRYKELQPKYGQQVNDQVFIARNDRDIRVIESHLAKLDNQDKLHQFKHQLRNLTKFTTKENISNCLKTCKQRGVNAFIDHSEKICAEAITSKINDDLQIMCDKFNPNIPLNGKSYNDIVVRDFKGKEHQVPEDYLVAIGRDKRIMHYIKPDSAIGKSIHEELSNRVTTQQRHYLRIRK